MDDYSPLGELTESEREDGEAGLHCPGLPTLLVPEVCWFVLMSLVADVGLQISAMEVKGLKVVLLVSCQIKKITMIIIHLSITALPNRSNVRRQQNLLVQVIRLSVSSIAELLACCMS